MARVGEIRRGDCVFVRNGNAVGAEIQKDRKAVVVSRNACCRSSHIIQVVYLTRQPSRKTRYHVKLNDGRIALCEQLYTVDIGRVEYCKPKLTPEEMNKISDAMRYQLNLEV